MTSSIWIELLNTSELLLALVTLYILFVPSETSRVKKRLHQILTGVAVGLLGIVLVRMAYVLQPGIVFDTRSVLLCLCGLFFGAIPTWIAIGITAAFRLYQGGAAAWVGTAVIFATGGAGLLLRTRLKQKPETLGALHLYGFGIAVHLIMLALMFLMPWETALAVVGRIWLPVMLIYPAATLVVGLLLQRSMKLRRTASALQTYESTHHNLFENNHVIMMLIDPRDGSIADANPAACAFYGWGRETMQRMNIRQINPLPPEKIEEKIAQVVEGDCRNFQFRHRLADGSEREVEVLSGPITIGGRELLYSVIYDITEQKKEEANQTRQIEQAQQARRALLSVVEDQKRAKAALKKSEENLRITLNSIGDAVISTDLDGRIASMNPVAESLTGWTKAEAAGRPIEEVFRIINEHTRQTVKSPVAAVLKSGIIVGLANHTLLLAKDGREIPIADSGAPIRDADGEITGVVLVFRDQTKERDARRALEASEEMMRTSQAVAHICSYSTTLNTEDIEKSRWVCSPEFYNLFGIDETYPHTIAGWAGFIHPDFRDEVVAYHESVIKEKTSFDKEYKIVRINDGTERWVHGTGELELDETGTPVRMHGAIQDITERKTAEEEQEESRRFLRTVLDTIPSRVWWKDIHSAFIGCNIHFARDAGMESPDQMTGKTDYDMCWKDQADRFVGDDRAVIESGQPKLGIQEFQTQKDGRTRWIETNKIPLKDHTGRIIGTVGSYADITARKQAEAELLRLSTAIEQSPEAVVITDTEGTIQYVNPAFTSITGYTREETVGKNPRILKSGKQTGAFYNSMWNTLLAGEVWSGEMVNKRKDETLYTEQASIAPVKDASGSVINFVAVTRDITEELQKEELFRQSQKMESVGQLAGGIAHDFNNILQAITGFSEILELSLPDDSPQQRNAKEILKAAKRAAGLTRQLLTFSRKQPVSRQMLSLNDVVRDTEVLLHTLLGENIRLKLSPADDLPPVYADAGQLSQIIINLAVNARDAMPGGGDLAFSTSRMVLGETEAAAIPDAEPGTFVCLSVADTGSGMSREVRERLFEPFFTTKEVGKGTGLGLAVVYGIVRQNGGWIDVESEAGRGARFRIALPAVQESPAEPDRRILVVEDDPEALQLACRILKRAGYEPIPADDAEQALRHVQTSGQDFGLLFSDIILPGQNGIELADRLREDRPNLPVLLFSGDISWKDRWETAAGKNYYFMQKPFTVTSLLAAVDEALQPDPTRKTLQ